MSFLRQNNRKPQSQKPHQFHSMHHQRSTPVVVPSVVGYILKRYVSNGRLHVQNCQGGHAMHRALRAKGVAL